MFKTLVPETIKGMVSGTRKLKYWVFDPLGYLYCPPACVMQCTLLTSRVILSLVIST